MNIIILVATFFLALLSLLYELVIAQTMAVLSSNAVVWYGLTVGVFIGAMGCGALLAGKSIFVRRPLGTLALIEVVLAVIGGSAPIILSAVHLVALSWKEAAVLYWGSVLFFGTALVLIFLVGLLTGIEVPVLIGMGEGSTPKLSSAKILAADYFGALIAGLAFPLVCVPYIGILRTGLVIAVASLVVAWALLYWEQRKNEEWKAIVLGFGILGMMFLAWQVPVVEQIFSQIYYETEDGAKVRRVHSPYQQIDIVPIPGGKDPVLAQMIEAYFHFPSGQGAQLQGWGLFLNGGFQFMADMEKAYHESLAYIPLFAKKTISPRILILGGGDGLLARDILRYPFLKEATLVELDPEMIRLFRDMPGLRALNGDAFHDPRLKVVVGDAYDFIRRDKGVYDIVYLDLPVARDYDLSKLYSREFYHFIRRRLAPDGLLVMDAPEISLGADSWIAKVDKTYWSVYAASLKAAGFSKVVPFFARVDEDNPAALSIMREIYAGMDYMKKTEILTATGEQNVVTIEGEEEVAREMLKGFTEQLNLGFIMASASDVVLSVEQGYQDLSLSFLDKDRYRKSMGSGKSLSVDVQPNSIFRPRLPFPGEWWNVRSAR